MSNFRIKVTTYRLDSRVLMNGFVYYNNGTLKCKGVLEEKVFTNDTEYHWEPIEVVFEEYES